MKNLSVVIEPRPSTAAKLSRVFKLILTSWIDRDSEESTGNKLTVTSDLFQRERVEHRNLNRKRAIGCQQGARGIQAQACRMVLRELSRDSNWQASLLKKQLRFNHQVEMNMHDAFKSVSTSCPSSPPL